VVGNLISTTHIPPAPPLTTHRFDPASALCTLTRGPPHTAVIPGPRLASPSPRRTPSQRRSSRRAGDSTWAIGIPPRSRANASTSASTLSVFRPCCPTPKRRTRVVSTTMTLLPHDVSKSCTCQASRHASMATTADAWSTPSSVSRVSMHETVSRRKTWLSFTSQ